MKKANLSFRSLRFGSYLHRFFLGDKGRRIHKAVLGIAALVCMSTGVSAQCNTFRNADAANPLLPVLTAGKRIAGFAFADIDADGDQDVYVDFLGKPAKQGDLLHLYRNIGTTTHPVFEEDMNTGFGKQLAGGQNGEMQFVDIDGDGDLDYFVSDSTNEYYGHARIHYFENVGTASVPNFVPGDESFLPSITERYIKPFAFADVDGDGDYDYYTAYVGPYLVSSYYQRVYFNTGTPQHPVFNTPAVAGETDYGIYRTYYDWNKDGLTDYFDTYQYYKDYGTTDYYKNTGPKNNPSFVADTATGPKFKGKPLYRILDLNGDGAPEMFDFDAHYYVLTPVAVITDTVVKRGNKPITILSSQYTNSSYTYRWEYNGTTIAGAGKYYIIPDRTGTYTLYVTDGCGTGVSLNYPFTKTTSLLPVADSKAVGITDANGIVARAYPNPFTNTVTLQLPGTAYRVEITDMAGRLVFTQATSANTLQAGGNLATGTYFIEVWQGEERVYKTKVIKR